LAAGLTAADWPAWRGPDQDGASRETGLPERWSPAGENLAWKAPYGARSGPVVFGRRLYLQNTAGRSTNWSMADDVQERVMCLDADTGKVQWEYRFNVALSDVPPNRVGWASPTVDTETGTVFALGVSARLVALSPEGRVVWDRSLTEEFGVVTTHGGRTVTPVVEGDLVIVGALMSGWGPWARGGNRYIAFDKRSGQTVWIASPQARHFDTNYSSPIVATIGGVRLLMVGGTDGAVHGIKAATGEPVWKFEMTKRAVNTAILIDGQNAIVTHSEENLDSSEMGMIASIDATASGVLGPQHVRWRTIGWQSGFSSPVMDAERIYQVDNGAILGAFDRRTGARIWTHGLGTIQKGSPVLADGKIYVGTENGKFYILRPGPTGVETLDEDLLGTPDNPEPVLGSPAVANGRVYVASMSALYAIGAGRPAAGAGAGATTRRAVPPPGPGTGEPAVAQVVPLDVLLQPGEAVKFRIRLFDAKGHYLRDATPTWSLESLQGNIAADGTFRAPAALAQAGAVKATVGAISATAHIRVIPPPAWTQDFESLAGEAPPPYWINATGKFVVRDAGGSRALFRLEDSTTTKRARVFMGPATLANYTVEADVRSIERRRQLGDVGLFAQRYGLILFGSSQRLELHPWQTAQAMTVAAPFSWKPDTWYRLKLRVQNRDDGTTLVQGKVWVRGESEPPTWHVEKIDRIPHRSGSPGIYADAPAGAWFDNITVTPNAR
jgi:outer membrane protein assembly factor BamB